jgi:large subunit ribosomal protein L1
MKSKNYKKAAEAFDGDKVYSLEEALEILEKFPKAKFDESVEVHICLNIDPKKSDQQIRATVSLPHGTGKVQKIAAFTETQQDEAKKAGAEVVGDEKLVAKIIDTKKIDFDVAVATPEMMPKLSKAARVLGPRGLMPNPKMGTVGPKVADMIKELQKGKADCKNDKTGNIHQVIGKRSFGVDKLKENAEVLLETISKNKPTKVKGKLLKTVTITATMTPGIKISQ